jgi:protein-tyrosine phosphatase
VLTRILFVCSANVCRSPSAQALALHRLAKAGLSGQLTVVSAGTASESRTGWCPEARKHVTIDDETAAIMGNHESHQVSWSGISKAAMVLSADRLTSSQVLRIDPHVRSRLFTMREAAALAQSVVEAELLPKRVDTTGVPEGLTGDTTSPADALEWLVTEMDAARGQVSLLSERRRHHGLFRTEHVPVLDIDIPDAHAGSRRRRAHHSTMPMVTSSVDDVMSSVVYVLERLVR